MSVVNCTAAQSENESDAVLLERRWFAAHKAAQALKVECAILRDIKDTAQANWRDATAKLADLDALCAALEHQYAHYVECSSAAFAPGHREGISAA